MKKEVLHQKTENIYIKQPVEDHQLVQDTPKKDPFTLDDYKLMLKILKEEKEKEAIKQENPLSDLNRLYQGMGE